MSAPRTAARRTAAAGTAAPRGLAVRRRRLRTPLGALAATALVLVAATVACASAARVSLPAIERQLMCVTCKVALNESQSPQAKLEREYVKELIAKGEGEGEIKRTLVAQYGPTVLAVPSAHGFDLAVYLVPAAVVLALLATVLALAPKWRARARSAPGAASEGAHQLSAADAARLEADLARFD